MASKSKRKIKRLLNHAVLHGKHKHARQVVCGKLDCQKVYYVKAGSIASNFCEECSRKNVIGVKDFPPSVDNPEYDPSAFAETTVLVEEEKS